MQGFIHKLFTMEISYHDVLLIVLAMLIGLVIGAEREYRSKSAGLRTLMLVTVGSCIFTMLSIKIGVANPDRLAANIITGIGFLGAGAIFKDDNRVNGLTTATAIWACAALGMSIGAGYILIGFAGTFSVLIVLSLLKYPEEFLDKKNRTRSYRIVCPYKNETLKRYEDLFAEHHLKAIRGKQCRRETEITGTWKVSGSEQKHQEMILVLLNDPEIKEFDF
jgi:putative Mg2+ transporter-C (MgtC) family protein